MSESPIVDMCVTLREGCAIGYLVTADGQAEFTFGSERQGFHYAFDAPVLRNFIASAAEALAELEAQAAQKRNG